MCWSAKVSLETFVLGCIGLVILYALSYYKLLLAFIFAFITVQLWEYFIWKYIDNPEKSRIFSFIIFIWIFLQPVIVICATEHKYLIKYYIGLILAVLCIFLLFSDPKFDFQPKVANDGHLDWNWTQNEMMRTSMIAIYLAFFLGILLYTKYYKSFVIGLALYLYSEYNYRKNKTASSMWCWFANLTIILCIIEALYLKIFKK